MTNQIIAVLILRTHIAHHKVRVDDSATIVARPISSRECELVVLTTTGLMGFSRKVHGTINALRLVRQFSLLT